MDNNVLRIIKTTLTIPFASNCSYETSIHGKFLNASIVLVNNEDVVVRGDGDACGTLELSLC